MVTVWCTLIPWRSKLPGARKKKGGGFVGGFLIGLLRERSKKLKMKESIRGGRQITRLDDEDLAVEDGDGAGPSDTDEVTTPGGGIIGRPPQCSSQPSTPVTNQSPTAIPYGMTTPPIVTTVPGTVGGSGDHISMPIPEVHEPGSPPLSNASTRSGRSSGSRMVRRRRAGGGDRGVDDEDNDEAEDGVYQPNI